MKQAELIDYVRRGCFRISDRGKSVLSEKPDRIDVHCLERFPEFVTFRDRRHKDAEDNLPKTAAVDNPEEALDAAYQRPRTDLETELLQQVKAASPSFFERLVVELFVKMGYGGNTCRQNDGTQRLEGLKFRNLRVSSRATGLEKGYLLRPRNSPRTLSISLTGSIVKSY
jgi:restriction endonuclease Mrr